MLLTYTELTDLMEEKRIKLKDLSNAVGMTRTGFRTSWINGTYPVKKIQPLLVALSLTPNQLFGIADGNTNSQMQNGGIGNTQIMESGMATLQDQLREKDAQISRLLSIIEK